MTPKTISSAANPEIRHLRRLERNRALREREGVYLAWGIHLAQEALASGARLERALVGPALEASHEGAALLAAMAEAGTPRIAVATHLLEEIAQGSGDQGILLVIRRPGTSLTALVRPGLRLLVAAHGVQDPGNLGGIVRSARAFGADGLCLLEGCADAFASRTVRAAMGAHFRLPLVRASTDEWLAAVESGGLRIVAADPSRGEPPAAVDLRGAVAIALGGEGAGLPADLLRRASHRVRIPMATGTDSLNVHAAAAVLLYEAVRQRGRAGRRG